VSRGLALPLDERGQIAGQLEFETVSRAAQRPSLGSKEQLRQEGSRAAADDVTKLVTGPSVFDPLSGSLRAPQTPLDPWPQLVGAPPLTLGIVSFRPGAVERRP
jgi:hypothetical protein